MERHWVKDYFTFTLKERIAILLLVGLILFVFFLPQFLPSKKWKPSEQEIADFNSIVKALQPDSADTSIDQSFSQREFPDFPSEAMKDEKKLFPFDPNAASSKEWHQLGLRDKTVKTILNYLSKGGRFRNPEDLRKIYGLREEEFVRLKPYIRIEDHKREFKTFKSETDSTHYLTNNNNTLLKNESRSPLIELNSTDTSELIRLPGIGNKLANRIINFRDRLGGFYSVEQVAETYGVPDSTFKKIKPFLILGNKPLNRININEADATRLKEHPYIGWRAANSIVEYRRQHGPFQRVEDILLVGTILPEQLKRLIPYLSTY